ncbi:MAG: acyl-CoA thioesterase II [Saprospiraceae bacterium]|nr:acyl-CoA thioesterase II [Saprospiraceae bacterium]MBK8670289.1 acyl-CoA thioesterase II [Saprospiraceae bacterium]
MGTIINSQLPELLDILTLKSEEPNVFIGKNLFIGSPNVYGGQVLAQAVAVANSTIHDEKILHSIHSYFINPGDNDIDITYKVEVVKNGKSFNTRRVVASQNGRDIFILSASYQKPENGIEHQDIMPNVARPESLTSFSDLFAEFAAEFKIQPRGIFAPNGPFVFHPVEHYDPFHPRIRPALNHTWFKTNGSLDDNPLLHQTTLAYASDFNLLITALFPHGLSFFTTPMQIASLDHAMWFHRPARTDDWLLYVVESSNANNGRAFCSGKIFTKDGILVASTAQEGLIRKL